MDSEMEKKNAGEWDEILGRSLIQKDTPLRPSVTPNKIAHFIPSI
jgi:hypothetical protein